MRFMRHTRRLAHARTRKVPRSLSLSAVRALHVLKHSLCLACALLITRSRFRDILTHLRASGSRYQYAGDSRNFRETWDVCVCDQTSLTSEGLQETETHLSFFLLLG